MSANRPTGNDIADLSPVAHVKPDDLGPGDQPLNDIETFADALFGRVAPEDIKRYPPVELAALASDAFAFLQGRTPGRPKIRVINPAAASRKELKTTTVVEIINDDMPFLVDSVMGELTER